MKWLLGFVVCCVVPSFALSQAIPIKTVPVATGNQFLLFPSKNLAMGGVSIALEDELLDPFVNPAKASWVNGAYLITAPVYYSISAPQGQREGSNAFSVPVGMVFQTQSSFFGGVYWARQRMDLQKPPTTNFFAPNGGVVSFAEPANANNTFNVGLIGTKIPGTNAAVALSGFWADLNSVEGVQLLFPNSTGVRQSGSSFQYQAGLVTGLDDNEMLEAVVVKSEFKMRYDITRTSPPSPGSQVPQPQTYVESNEDQTNMWGMRVGYLRPLASDWRLGAQLTANWKEHPKIPNYQIMNIPRDPGTSSAYNLGIGLSKRDGMKLFGMDLVYEPIKSDTWADAGQILTTTRGDKILPGQKTVENSFNFSNWIVRMGYRLEKETSDFQLGAQLHYMSYNLLQVDHVQVKTTDIDQHWNEWTLSIGYGLRFSTLQIRYTGLATFGTGLPIASTSWDAVLGNGAMEATSLGDFLPAVNRPLSVRESVVFTHQVSFSTQIF